MPEMITEAEQDVVLKQAAELSELFREVGPTCDRENRFAHETVQAYKDSGLGRVPIPKELGGHGGTILTTSKVMTALSEGDSAIALAYNMHYITVGLCLGLLTEEQQEHWFKRVVDGEIMFGPISKARAGFSGLSDTRAVPQPGGGYKLARDMGGISVAEIIIAVDEPIDATQCGGKENCRDEQKCLTHDLWSALNKHIFDYLEAVTLRQLVDAQRDKDAGVSRVQDMRATPNKSASVTA